LCAGDGRLPGRARFPDILTDGDADGNIPDGHHARDIPRLKITLLVEDTVIRQVLLAVAGDD